MAVAGDTLTASARRRDDADDEAAALARHAAALDGDGAPLQLGQALADRKSEACPAEPSRDRGVRLAERLEQPVDAVRRDADARVADRDVDFPVPLRIRTGDRHRSDGTPGDRHDDLARRRELDRIRQEIEDDLAQPAGIPMRACGSFGSRA